MGRLSQSATIETDLFEHKTVKDDFINPCCFGEDFAAWLQSRLKPMTEFTLDEPLMEDFGWAFGVKHDTGAMLVALSYGHEGPVEGPATWIVSVDWQSAGLLQRWFAKPDEAVFRAFAQAIWQILQSEPGIRVESLG